MTSIIAELSGNHGGDLAKAKEMIRVAHQCGCSAVKIQVYKPEDMHDPANNDLYRKCMVPQAWYPALFEAADRIGITLFASVFATWAVDFLEKFDCPIYKIASPESTRLPGRIYLKLAEAIKRTGAEFYVSSGAADMGFMQGLEPDVAFYCKKGYPAHLTDEDLLWAEAVGAFSDHTPDIIGSLAMIKAGATHIEKHFRLDDDCVDAAFSLNPDQMKLLCRLA